MAFIPAQESRLFIRLFRVYVRLLFKRRFKQVWIRQQYRPGAESKTVYYLNHHSWWDGIIPLLLNEYRFKQQARALMEDKQMKKYAFFKRIGAFSIDREDPKKALTSLRYAVESMQRKNASLFIYPEGTITAAGTQPSFEGGLTWLHAQLPEVDFVPIGIYMHTIRSDKPELHLHVGKSVTVNAALPRQDKTQRFEETLSYLLDELKATAGFDDSVYDPFF